MYNNYTYMCTVIMTITLMAECIIECVCVYHTTNAINYGVIIITTQPARPELPPHLKEGRNEAVGRPNQRSTPGRNPRSQPGARRREERGRPSEPGLFTFIILL